MLFRLVVTSPAGIVYVFPTAPVIFCPPLVLLLVFLYHWYTKVPLPVTFTVYVTSVFPAITCILAGCPVILAFDITLSSATAEFTVSVLPPYVCITVQ